MFRHVVANQPHCDTASVPTRRNQATKVGLFPAIFRKVERLWIVFGRELNNLLRADFIAPEFFDGSYFNVLEEVGLDISSLRISDSWFGVQLGFGSSRRKYLGGKPVRQRKLKPTL